MGNPPKSSFGRELKSLAPTGPRGARAETFPKQHGPVSENFRRPTPEPVPGSLADTNMREAMELAKERYFAGCTKNEIIELTGMPLAFLNREINRSDGWREQRTENNLKITRQLHNLQRDRYAIALDNALQVLERGVARLNSPMEDPETGKLLKHPVTGAEVYKELPVAQLKKVAEIAGVLQVMHEGAIARGDEAAAKDPRAMKTVVTVEGILLRLQAVDQIGFGADESSDEADVIDITDV